MDNFSKEKFSGQLCVPKNHLGILKSIKSIYNGITLARKEPKCTSWRPQSVLIPQNVG